MSLPKAKEVDLKVLADASKRSRGGPEADKAEQDRPEAPPPVYQAVIQFTKADQMERLITFLNTNAGMTIKEEHRIEEVAREVAANNGQPVAEEPGTACSSEKSSGSQRDSNADAPKSPPALQEQQRRRRTNFGTKTTSSNRASSRASPDPELPAEQPVAARTRRSIGGDQSGSQPLQNKEGVKRHEKLSEASIAKIYLLDSPVRSSERDKPLQHAENIAGSSKVTEPLDEHDAGLSASSSTPDPFLDAASRNQGPVKPSKKNPKPKGAPRASGTSGSSPASRPTSRTASRPTSSQGSKNPEAEKPSRPSRIAKVPAQQKRSDGKKNDSRSNATRPSKSAAITIELNSAPKDVALRRNAELQKQRDEHYGVRASSPIDPTANFGRSIEERREKELAQNNRQHRRDDQHVDDGPQDPDPMGQAPRDQDPEDWNPLPDFQIEAAHEAQEEDPEDEEPDKNEPGPSTRNLRARKRFSYCEASTRVKRESIPPPPQIKAQGDPNREMSARFIDGHMYYTNLVGEVTVDDDFIVDEDCPFEDACYEDKDYVDENPDDVIPEGMFPTRYSKYFKITRAAHELSDGHCLLHPDDPAKAWVESMKEEETKLRKLSTTISKVRDFPFSHTELDIVWDTTPMSKSAKDKWPTRHMQVHVFMAQEMIRQNRKDYEDGSLTAAWDDPIEFVKEIADQCELYVTVDAGKEIFQDPALVSLVDVIERNEHTEIIYGKLAEMFPKNITSLNRLMTDYNQQKPTATLLKKWGFPENQIFKHLIDMVHNKYMPRGGLYLKLLLNFAYHFQFLKAKGEWGIYAFEEETLFKGVEFNFVGKEIEKTVQENIHNKLEKRRESGKVEEEKEK